MPPNRVVLKPQLRRAVPPVTVAYTAARSHRRGQELNSLAAQTVCAANRLLRADCRFIGVIRVRGHISECLFSLPALSHHAISDSAGSDDREQRPIKDNLLLSLTASCRHRPSRHHQDP